MYEYVLFSIAARCLLTNRSTSQELLVYSYNILYLIYLHYVHILWYSVVALYEQVVFSL